MTASKLSALVCRQCGVVMQTAAPDDCCLSCLANADSVAKSGSDTGGERSTPNQQAAATILKQGSDAPPEPQPQPRDVKVELESSLGKLGRFPLLSVVGEGASGIVYRAIDPTLQRPVAVKAPRFVSNDPKQAERFLREARAVARLRHPNIAMVFDCGQDKNTFYIASEFIDGENFEQRLAKSPPSIRQSVEWVRDAARGLEYAHQKGIVHRDVKPANLMLSTDNRVVITDFGIARRMEETSTMTADGAVLGTPA